MRRAWCFSIVGLCLATATQADLSSTISHVKPSVVILGTYRPTNSPRFTLRGTGFVVGDKDVGKSNLIITNAHVLQPASPEEEGLTDLVVQFHVARNTLQMRVATVLEVDTVHDLALLRFEGPWAPSLRVGDSDAVREGQAVAFTGFPIGAALGFSPVTHHGVISSIAAAALPTPSAKLLNEKSIRGIRSGSFEIFQLDGTAYPGNSGGPLFDPETGDVLGVVNMVFIKGTRESALTNPSGISYAVPAVHILQLLQHAKAGAP